ncbi:uncharacterized protein LOC106130690 [Amyelois transitella]|uniref:uncharacterized protein LOC106130690 n=1 Tax=Amyelois transitella TaxID=680683 RepID=UPI00298F707F|nr:uncharacterized protein LOC106130690 [Amyelois transitella]
MYCEWPEFRRCCFCLPLRRGILILAYVNIICSILESVMYFTDSAVLTVHRSYMELPYELNIALVLLDIVATLVFLFGLHTKRELYVRVYYNFMIFSLSASVPLTVIELSLMSHPHTIYFTIFYFIFTTIINIYLLLMVRSMVRKLQIFEGNTFDNQLADIVQGSTQVDQHHTTVNITDDASSKSLVNNDTTIAPSVIS